MVLSREKCAVGWDGDGAGGVSCARFVAKAVVEKPSLSRRLSASIATSPPPCAPRRSCAGYQRYQRGPWRASMLPSRGGSGDGGPADGVGISVWRGVWLRQSMGRSCFPGGWWVCVGASRPKCEIGMVAGKMGGDLLGPVMGVDGDAPAARARGRDGVVEQRAARDLDQGFRPVGGQCAHARAEPRGKDHHVRGHAATSPQWALSARRRATGACSGDSAGCAAARSISRPVRGRKAA